MSNYYKDIILSDSPIAYWRMGESSGTTLNDESPNGNVGTYNTSPTFGEDGVIVGEEVPDTATLFSGSEEAVIPYTSEFSSSEFTVECWIKPNASSLSTRNNIVSRENNANFVLTIGSTANKIVLFCRGSSWTACQSVATLSADTWYHVLGTFDGTNISLYINGVLDNSVPISGSYVTNSTDLVVGGFPTAVNYRLNGTIDEVAFYDYVLTDDQILNHYNKALNENGAIEGTTKKNNISVDCSVRLHRVDDSSFIVEQTSSGGIYSFKGYTLTDKFYVVCIDTTDDTVCPQISGILYPT